MRHLTDDEILAAVTRVPRSASEIYLQLMELPADIKWTTPKRKVRRHIGKVLQGFAREGLVHREMQHMSDRTLFFFWRESGSQDGELLPQ